MFEWQKTQILIAHQKERIDRTKIETSALQLFPEKKTLQKNSLDQSQYEGKRDLKVLKIFFTWKMGRTS